MKKYLIAMIAVLGMGTLAPAFAGNGNVFAGALLGGAAGAAIGHQFDGRNSEAIGAVIGAGIGASIASDNNRGRYVEPRYGYAEPVAYRPAYREPPHRVVVVHERRDSRYWHDNGRHRGWDRHDLRDHNDRDNWDHNDRDHDRHDGHHDRH